MSSRTQSSAPGLVTPATLTSGTTGYKGSRGAERRGSRDVRPAEGAGLDRLLRPPARAAARRRGRRAAGRFPGARRRGLRRAPPLARVDARLHTRPALRAPAPADARDRPLPAPPLRALRRRPLAPLRRHRPRPDAALRHARPLAPRPPAQPP